MRARDRKSIRLSSRARDRERASRVLRSHPVLRDVRVEWVEDLHAGHSRVLGCTPYRLAYRWDSLRPRPVMTQQPLFDDLILEAGRRAFALEHPLEERGAIRLRMCSAYLPTERAAMRETSWLPKPGPR